MRRAWFWSLLVFALVAGFLLGRASDTGGLPAFTSESRSIPLFPKPPKDTPNSVLAIPQDGDIIVETPVENAVLTDPLLDVTGRAKVAGGPLKVSVVDSSGIEIAAARVDVFSEGGEFGRFGNTFAFAARPNGAASVIIARASGEGTPITKRVTFGDAGATGIPAPAAEENVALKIFLANGKMGSNDDCSMVFAVERRVPAKIAGFKAIIEELLKGPTKEESGAGYKTSIPTSAELKSVAADAEGIVTADFTAALDRNIGGSCRVGSIRAQIEKTLSQFPEVHGVIISVNGASDTALQP
jgi:hypothetical protein